MRFSYDHFGRGVPKAAGGGIQVIIIGVQVPRPAKPGNRIHQPSLSLSLFDSHARDESRRDRVEPEGKEKNRNTHTPKSAMTIEL
jgi:hypothetical protein